MSGVPRHACLLIEIIFILHVCKKKGETGLGKTGFPFAVKIESSPKKISFPYYDFYKTPSLTVYTLNKGWAVWFFLHKPLRNMKRDEGRLSDVK